MRMRKKRHLDERAAACSDVSLGWLQDHVREQRGENIPELIDTMKIFGNNNPLRLEIGCGKGQFIQQCAELHPDINFIALEMTLNVLVTAMERTHAAGTQNLRYLTGMAEYLEKVFPPESVETIYLNFSTPFPKKSYAKHRLTHPRFLEIYSRILKNGGEILQKTDDKDFFEYSLNTLSDFGFRLSDISFDLHKSGAAGNIITEYEQRFTDMGLPIYSVRAIKNSH